MFNEVKAEIIELIGNKIFARNLSLTLIMAVLSLYTLADLQSQETQVSEKTSIINISHPSALKIMVERQIK
ncbi:MAG: hypothetical protein AAF383_01960 [Cyanobacteria bacterium P01_A01_bin.83]